MDRLEAMDIFVRIVETGSFSAVARDLGTTQPTISKQITALERRLKTRLLERSTRSLNVTASGTTYYERCKRILEDVKAAEGALGRLQSSLTGTLHVNGSIALGQLFLTPLLLEFQRRYPELTVELTLNDRYIDLVEEGVDVAVRLGRLADSHLVARRLGATRRVLVATRTYLDAHGTPQEPAQLARHNCLLYAYLSTGNEWTFRGPQGDLRVHVHGNFKANNGHSIREAMLAGADLGVHTARGGQQHANEARLVAAIERMLVQAARRDLRCRLRGFAREPQDLGDGVADRLDVVRPLVELLSSLRGRRVQPVGIVRQVERAGAARNGAAVPYRGQKLAFFQWVNDLRAGLRQLLLELADVVDQLRQPVRIDAGLAAVTAEELGVPLELLADVGAHVAPS